MNQVKVVPAKRVFPGAIAYPIEFFIESDADRNRPSRSHAATSDRFYERAIEKRSRMERIDRVTVVMKFSNAAESGLGCWRSMPCCQNLKLLRGIGKLRSDRVMQN